MIVASAAGPIAAPRLRVTADVFAELAHFRDSLVPGGLQVTAGQLSEVGS